MFETIIWATDGSELSDRALPLVKSLAQTYGSRVVAVHANALLIGRLGGAPMLADEPEVQAKLREQVAELKAEGFQALLRIEPAASQTAAHALARTATLFDADLIVIATHAYGVLGTLIDGSVTKALIREAPCAVLVVPPRGAVPRVEAPVLAESVA